MPVVTMPLVIGRGLDRATGLAGAQPQFPVDARNVYARDAKMSLRPGLAGTGFPPIATGTDLLAIAPVKATLDILYVVYDRNSGVITVLRLNTATSQLQTLTNPAGGVWGVVNAEFPVITWGESNGLMFFAHDEADINSRLATIYYTPNANSLLPGSLATLTQDLDGSGIAQPVFFRSVRPYLVYMLGAGYGSHTEPDRGDILRLSNPTDPLTWGPQNLVYFGVKKDPIIGMVEVVGPPAVTGTSFTQPSALGILKADSTFILSGSSFNDFVPLQIDSRFGTVSSRCSINVGGTAYTWSSDGPRQVTPTGTVQIGQALELISPLPADFPVNGPGRLAFVSFDLDRKILEWCFPNTVAAAVPVPCFALSLWNPQDPRWTFFERQQPVSCAAAFTSRDTGAPPVAPKGFPSAIVAIDTSVAANPSFRSVSIQWGNNGTLGNETVELFAQPVGGLWSSVRQVAVGLSTQTTTWDFAAPLTSYNLAMRYLTGGVPAVGYESADPDNWTAATAPQSKATVITTSAPVAFTSGAFFLSPNRIVLTWASAQVGVPYLVEYSNNGGGVWNTLAAALVGSTLTYNVPNGELGLNLQFRVTAKNGAIVGPTTGPLVVFAGFVVAQPTWVSGVFDPSTALIALTWNPANNAAQYLLEKTDNAGVSWSAVATVVGATTYSYPITPAEVNQTVGFRLTGQNGTYSSAVSATQNVNCPMVIGVTNITGLIKVPPAPGGPPVWTLDVTWNPDPAGPIIAVQVEWSVNGGVLQTDSVNVGNLGEAFNTGLPFPAANGTHWSVRVRGVGAGPTYGAYCVPATIDV